MPTVVKAGQADRTSSLVKQGLQLILQGRYEEALAVEDKAIGLSPRDPNAHSYRGSALFQLGRINEALACYDKVVRLVPNAAVAHYNRANALQRLGRHQDALLSLKTSLKLQPSYTDALSLTGIVLQAMGSTDAALQHYDAALKINPHAADAHYNKGFALLAKGDFRDAWDHYEWRLRWDVTIRDGQSRSIDPIAPDWDGMPTEKPVLVVPEQGLGDQIFYAGMLADLQAVVPGSTVCLEPRLIPLFQRSFERLKFSSPYDIDPEQCKRDCTFGAQIHIGSLGRFFRSDSSGLNKVITPYLKPDAYKTSQLSQRLKQSGRLVCGVSWRSKNAKLGAAKSITLRDLSPLFSIDGIDFVDLQYGDTGDERENLQKSNGIHVRHLDDIDNTNDIDSLASLISACDVVVTISNVTAHIAAALGKPTLIMLPNSSSLFWYWHRDRTDSPWYPTARLIRQTSSSTWTDVIETARYSLLEFSRTKTL